MSIHGLERPVKLREIRKIGTYTYDNRNTSKDIVKLTVEVRLTDQTIFELLRFIKPSGGVPMSYPKNLPNPTLPRAEWTASIIGLGEAVNLRHHRDASGRDRKLWLIEGARQLVTAIHSRILKVELSIIDGERVNCYTPHEDAIEFWKNGKEQNLSDDQILEGWVALQSILRDGKEG